MSRVIWTLPAQTDLAAIDDYHADLDTAFADRVGRTAIAGARFLAEHPAAGVEILRDQHDRRDRPMP